MSKPRYYAEASKCREKALGYKGRPEKAFLLSVARAFEELATQPRH
jgi:hypothetical protein